MKVALTLTRSRRESLPVYSSGLAVIQNVVRETLITTKSRCECQCRLARGNDSFRNSSCASLNIILLLKAKLRITVYCRHLFVLFTVAGCQVIMG